MCNMSRSAKFYEQLHMRSLTNWIFAAVLTDCGQLPPFFYVVRRVDAFNKIEKRTSAPISCWKFTHHLNSTLSTTF